MLENYINKKLFYQTLISIDVLFILSFISWQLPLTRDWLTGVVVLLFILFSIKDLRYGMYLIILELLVGVQGYILAFEFSNFSLSLRICFFIIWLSMFTSRMLTTKSSDFLAYFRAKWWIFSIPFFIIFFGLSRAMSNELDFYLIFFDVNGYLFWFYALPFLYLGLNKTKLLTLITVGVTWIIGESLVLFYTFGHHFNNFNLLLYHWLRDWRMIEITEITLALYRIFMQNQIFLLLVLGLIFTLIIQKQKVNYYYLFYFVILSLGLIISFSRSMWLGIAAMVILLVYVGLNKKIKNILHFSWKNFIIYGLFGLILSSGLWLSIAHLPLPAIDWDSLDIHRFSLDASANARLRMLEPLQYSLRQEVLLGYGFGKTLTYFTTDPRIVNSTAGNSGQYTTFAFEWGYLDIALKIGIIGLLVYISFLFKFVKDLFKQFLVTADPFIFGLVIAMIALLITNITTPYLNHPQGIGFIIVILLISNIYSRDQIQIK